MRRAPSGGDDMAVGGGTVGPVSRQDAPSMAGAYSHQLCRLIQCHMLCQKAVRNLKPSLSFRRQSHILNSVNVTFMLAR